MAKYDATMPEEKSMSQTDKQISDVQQFLAERQNAGLLIDPETAEVLWIYAETLDPYGIHPDLPVECHQIGREYFARTPGSKLWVHFDDLPEATGEALWAKHKNKLAFPAGLEEMIALCGWRASER
jgi:hypothetical protein